MPKRKIKEPEAIDDLLNDLRTSGNEIKNKLDEVLSAEEIGKGEGVREENTVDEKRAELIRLSEDGEIGQSVKYIRKASEKVINKIQLEYKSRRLERANVFLTDLIISKFSGLLGGLDSVESSDELERLLLRDKLRNVVESAVRRITPLLPFLGILSGGVTVGKHVFDHKRKQVGPVFTEKPPEERTEEEVKKGYDTVN